VAHQNLSAADALTKLKEGNQRYLDAVSNPGDVSPAIRKKTCEHGQSPYAVVITCSDSRVIPESIFTAGIGENTQLVRSKVLAYLGYLGIAVDEEANTVRGEERVISTPDSKVKVMVIPTNEELAIARETVALV